MVVAGAQLRTDPVVRSRSETRVGPVQQGSLLRSPPSFAKASELAGPAAQARAAQFRPVATSRGVPQAAASTFRRTDIGSQPLAATVQMPSRTWRFFRLPRSVQHEVARRADQADHLVEVQTAQRRNGIVRFPAHRTGGVEGRTPPVWIRYCAVADRTGSSPQYLSIPSPGSRDASHAGSGHHRHHRSVDQHSPGGAT